MTTTGSPGRLVHQHAASPWGAGPPPPAADLDGQWGASAGCGDVGRAAAAHLPELLRYATALTGDADRAAVVMERVLLRTRSGARLGMTERADLLLRRLVLQEHLSWRGRRRAGVRAPARHRPPGARPDAGATAGPAGEGEQDPLLGALGALAPRDRAVVVLRYHEGLPDEEVAAVLRTSRSAVRRRAVRALAAVGSVPAPPPAPHASTTTKEQR